MSTTSIKISFNSKGFEDILCSHGVANCINQEAMKIQSRANTIGACSFLQSGKIGRAYGCNRYIGFVYTGDSNSMRAEATMHALEKAVNADEG
jgi:hypothetical protein